MMELIVVLFVAFLLILEGGFLAFSTKKASKAMMKASKNKQTLITFGFTELLIGLALVILVISSQVG